jgi:hypothetical protein
MVPTFEWFVAALREHAHVDDALPDLDSAAEG